MKIHVTTIPHEEQRYPTAGDWWWDGDTLEMRVSTLPDWRYGVLVTVHELVEAVLCKAHGVTAEAVDAWDTGIGKDIDDPGDDPRAPYHREHRAASALERRLARDLGVNWDAYNDALDAL
jgi:hypothetical protein